MRGYRILAVAVTSDRVGSVLLVGDRLMDWRISGKAGTSVVAAQVHAQSLINTLMPDVVVTETPGVALRKGQRTKDMIAAIARVAADNCLLDVSVERNQTYANKYAEAEALVERWPDIAAWKPKKRRFFDSEPRNTVLFEALALAKVVWRQGSV